MARAHPLAGGVEAWSEILHPSVAPDAMGGFYAAADITAYLKEVGLFGHSTASSTLGTGELFNRAILNFDNSAGAKDLTVVSQVTFG